MLAARVLTGALLLASIAAPAAAAEKFKPFRLETPDGVERTLADVRGRATLVVFFFPTCPYCNASFPAIQRLHDTYRKEGLSCVWINVVPEEERLIEEWRTRHGYTVPILLGRRSVVRDYRLTMTPTHYLLDADGQVLLRHAGYTDGDEKALEEHIRLALGLPPAVP